MSRQENKLMRIATVFASREAAFMYAVLGIITQIFHNWWVSYQISSFNGVVKTSQAIIMATFISFALLYFTLRSTGRNRKVETLMWIFFIFEAFLNTFYYVHKLIFVPGFANADWLSLSIAIPFAFMIPFTLKSYGGEIKVNDEESEVQSITGTEYLELTEELELIKSDYAKDKSKYDAMLHEFKSLKNANAQNVEVVETINEIIKFKEMLIGNDEELLPSESILFNLEKTLRQDIVDANDRIDNTNSQIQSFVESTNESLNKLEENQIETFKLAQDIVTTKELAQSASKAANRSISLVDEQNKQLEKKIDSDVELHISFLKDGSYIAPVQAKIQQ